MWEAPQCADSEEPTMTLLWAHSARPYTHFSDLTPKGRKKHSLLCVFVVKFSSLRPGGETLLEQADFPEVPFRSQMVREDLSQDGHLGFKFLHRRMARKIVAMIVFIGSPFPPGWATS